MVGGGDGRIDKPFETACILLHHMNCYDIHPVVYSHNTNELPAVEDLQTVQGVKSIVNYFNKNDFKLLIADKQNS